MKKLLSLIISVGFVFSSVYNTGDQISIAHQNVEFPIGYGSYPSETLKLADFNGELNGGSYRVLFIDMAASW